MKSVLIAGELWDLNWVGDVLGGSILELSMNSGARKPLKYPGHPLTLLN